MRTYSLAGALFGAPLIGAVTVNLEMTKAFMNESQAWVEGSLAY